MESKNKIDVGLKVLFTVVILLLFYGLIISSLSNSSDIACNTIDNNEYTNASSDEVYTSSSILSPIYLGITSSEVKANNQTWINCTTSDSLVVDINESKATVSLWFNNATTDWTSLIKSDGNIYINGSLDAAWTWLPYFVSSDIITFCKTDGSTFIDVSIDAVRVYEQALNSTEVTQVYNYGR